MILYDPGQNPVCDPSHDPFVVRAMNCDVKAIYLSVILYGSYVQRWS